MAITRKNKQYTESEFKNKILPLRAQGALKNKWLKYRLENILPNIMRRDNMDMWIIITREYNEDPVFMSLMPSPEITAWGRPILVFTLKENGTLEKLMIQRRPMGGQMFEYEMPAHESGDQWVCLRDIVKERDPKSIGINVNEHFAFSDGLSHNDYLRLKEAIGEEYMARTKSAVNVAMGWLETRTEEEMEAYESICHLAHSIIDEAFSPKVIVPGVTTPQDVQWWIRQKMADLNVPAWFPPNIQILRQGVNGYVPETEVIHQGDILWSDYGIQYLGLCTDQQEWAYVLKRGEKEPPKGIQDALKEGNKLQDILASCFVEGKTGNEILLSTLEAAKKAGVRGSIYTHPIGHHGHGAGPMIGRYDTNLPVPGKGDYPLYANTCHSMELYAIAEIPEWDNQEIHVMLEQDIVFTGGKVYFLDGRQEEIHII